MDRVMMSGVHMTDQFQTLLICACLRLAALQESAHLPTGLAVSALTEFPGKAAGYLLQLHARETIFRGVYHNSKPFRSLCFGLHKHCS